MLKKGDIFNGEIIQKVMKKHSIVCMPIWILCGIGFLMTLGVFYFYRENYLLYFGLICFWQIIFLGTYFCVVGKNIDMIILTENKIIIIQKNSFLKRKMKDFPLEDIKEMKFISSGVFATFFCYGNIHLSFKNYPDTFLLKYYTVKI